MVNASNKSQWHVFPKPNPVAKMRLFCFPYAGGSASIYRAWADKLPRSVEVCAIQLPGRGARIRETPFTRMSSLIEALARAIHPLLDKPFAFFGHSMGAMIAFELACRLQREYGTRPVHLFVSGRRAPQILDPDITYNLPEPEFIEELMRINGTPKEVLEHPELRDMMVPLLRADFQVCQTYEYEPQPPLDYPITAFGGVLDDDELRAYLEAWRERTRSAFSLHMLPGDHFFLHTCEDALLQTLSRILQDTVFRLR